MTAERPAPRPPSRGLLVLAVLSFVPVAGVLCGAAAVVWGLRAGGGRGRTAVVLGTAGTLAGVLELVVALLLFRPGPQLQQAKNQVARQDLDRIVVAIAAYRRRSGQLPAELPMLVRPRGDEAFNIMDHSASLFGQRYYQYVVVPGAAYDLFAVGADGKPGTADDVRPDLPDSVLAASGYVPGLARQHH